MNAHPLGEPPAIRAAATSAPARYLYIGHGEHARPVVSDEAHDPLTERGRRAICHLIALAEYDRAAFRTDIAHIRHCQARASYLHARLGLITRHDLDEVLRRPPVATVRSLLPHGWDEVGTTSGAVPTSRCQAPLQARRATESGRS